jgi:hypothetical protein
MIRLKKLNSILGWSVFAVGFIIYLITVSRTVNFWDCGEIIACSNKLQIGHPSGAPFYMILARFFSLFALNSKYIALTTNLLSVFASAFTLYFLYHTIFKLSLRILDKKLQDLSQTDAIIGFGSAIIGTLAFAFSNTFWASAIETEVYSVSILFSAICVWVMLKWSENRNSEGENRWLILCSLLLGLSIGVHLLNILVIPALVFIYYFYSYKFTYKGFFKTLGIALGMLIFVQYFISFIPYIASKFELIFVNDFGFGYNSGLYFFALFLIATLVLSIYISGIKKKPVLNLILTCFAVFVTGYSTYTIILIRSAANPPIDQNNPETIFNFISYLNREQYGNSPLWYGQYYNSELDKNTPYVEGEPVYDTVENAYSIIAYKPESNYLSSQKSILPRMWSN